MARKPYIYRKHDGNMRSYRYGGYNEVEPKTILGEMFEGCDPATEEAADRLLSRGRARAERRFLIDEAIESEYDVERTR